MRSPGNHISAIRGTWVTMYTHTWDTNGIGAPYITVCVKEVNNIVGLATCGGLTTDVLLAHISQHVGSYVVSFFCDVHAHAGCHPDEWPIVVLGITVCRCVAAVTRAVST